METVHEIAALCWPLWLAAAVFAGGSIVAGRVK